MQSQAHGQVVGLRGGSRDLGVEKQAAVSMRNLPSASNPSLPSSLYFFAIECLLCVGPVLSPSSEGLYSLVRQTDLGQVNCRCHVECELP